jgi:hypothetical protein
VKYGFIVRTTRLQLTFYNALMVMGRQQRTWLGRALTRR